MKNFKDLSDILNIKNQKKDFDIDINNILNIFKKTIDLDLDKKDIYIKGNIIKIKTNSDKKFVIFLNLNKLNQEINLLNKGFIIEL